MQIEMSFPGGLRVDAQVRDHVVRTDQPVTAGGEGSAAAPFDLFLASIGACAGLYALQFCAQRGIPTDDLGMRLVTVHDPERHRVGTVRIEVDLPAEFPAKYRPAILRAIDQCAVKRHIVEAPTFEVALGDPVDA